MSASLTIPDGPSICASYNEWRPRALNRILADLAPRVARVRRLYSAMLSDRIGRLLIELTDPWYVESSPSAQRLRCTYATMIVRQLRLEYLVADIESAERGAPFGGGPVSLPQVRHAIEDDEPLLVFARGRDIPLAVDRILQPCEAVDHLLFHVPGLAGFRNVRLSQLRFA